MPKSLPDRQEILETIRKCAQVLGHSPFRAEFKAHSGMTEYQVLQHFPSWREAVRAAGLEADSTNLRLDDETLLQDWGALVRANRQIPTRDQYRVAGSTAREFLKGTLGLGQPSPRNSDNLLMVNLSGWMFWPYSQQLPRNCLPAAWIYNRIRACRDLCRRILPPSCPPANSTRS